MPIVWTQESSLLQIQTTLPKYDNRETGIKKEWDHSEIE